MNKKHDVNGNAINHDTVKDDRIDIYGNNNLLRKIKEIIIYIDSPSIYSNDALKSLISNSNINHQNNIGDTAIILVCNELFSKGYREKLDYLALILIEAGADLFIENNKKENALTYLRIYNNYNNDINNESCNWILSSIIQTQHNQIKLQETKIMQLEKKLTNMDEKINEINLAILFAPGNKIFDQAHQHFITSSHYFNKMETEDDIE